jgi:hypothetical protein
MRLPLPNNLFKEQQHVPVQTVTTAASGLSNPAVLMSSRQLVTAGSKPALPHNFELCRLSTCGCPQNDVYTWCSELSSGLYCRVKWLSTDVSEVRTASIYTDQQSAHSKAGRCAVWRTLIFQRHSSRHITYAVVALINQRPVLPRSSFFR